MTRVVIGLPKVYFDLSPQHGLSVRLVRVEQTSSIFLISSLSVNSVPTGLVNSRNVSASSSSWVLWCSRTVLNLDGDVLHKIVPELVVFVCHLTLSNACSHVVDNFSGSFFG
jgi:hypothetical protein